MITLRRATEKDGNALAAIYKYYVENTAITFEYIAPNGKEFAERIARKSEKYPFIIAEENGVPVGYAYASQYRERAAYSWDVELSVYIDTSYQGRVIGKRLYTALEKLLDMQNVVNLYACITYPNPHSVAMHESLGFKYIGRFHRTGFKRGEWHDVFWLEKQISFPTEPIDIIPFSQLDEKLVDRILNNN